MFQIALSCGLHVLATLHYGYIEIHLTVWLDRENILVQNSESNKTEIAQMKAECQKLHLESIKFNSHA